MKWQYRRSKGSRSLGGIIAALLFVSLLAACGSASTATDTPKSVTQTATGVVTSAPVTATQSVSASAIPSGTGVSATTPASATTVATTTSAAADPRGVAPTKRGGGGTLRVLYWQAPTTLSVHVGNGSKDVHAARLVLEPLAVTSLNAIYPDVPMLAKAIPSAGDGSIAADGKRVTWKLKDGVKWSDGTPFTSDDVKATWQYIMDPKNGASTTGQYASIAAIDTPDAMTVTINFKDATALWYTPFTNGNGAVLEKKQIESCGDPKNCDLIKAPVGTGPYKVKSFTPGDNVQYVINDTFRESNAPYFDAVDWKGGGDAGTAAKAVQAGQVDFAWNLQVTPDVLKQVTDAGKALDGGPGFGVEQIALNFTDPTKEVDGEKSSVKAPHPFLTDPKVREALMYLIDRDSITTNLYGAAGKPACNVLLGIPAQLQSKTTTCGFNVAKANQILDDAGWKKGSDGIRAKDGVKLQVTMRTTVGALREKEEQVIKQAFGQAGIGMEIANVDAGVFYGQPDNPDQLARFQADLELVSAGYTDPDPQDLLATYTTKAIPQKANGWKANNIGRWSNPEFDALFEQLKTELNPEKRATIERQMNDLIVNNHARLPIVDRYTVNGRRADLINTNYTAWDSALWNVAYWQIKK